MALTAPLPLSAFAFFALLFCLAELELELLVACCLPFFFFRGEAGMDGALGPPMANGARAFASSSPTETGEAGE